MGKRLGVNLIGTVGGKLQVTNRNWLGDGMRTTRWRGDGEGSLAGFRN